MILIVSIGKRMKIMFSEDEKSIIINAISVIISVVEKRVKEQEQEKVKHPACAEGIEAKIFHIIENNMPDVFSKVNLTRKTQFINREKRNRIIEEFVEKGFLENVRVDTKGAPKNIYKKIKQTPAI